MAQVADGDLVIKTQIDNSEIKKGTKQTEKEVKSSTKNISKEYEKVDKSAEGAAKGVEKVGNATKKIDSAAVEKLTKKLENTNAQIELQKKKLAELRETYQRVTSAFGTESPQALAIQDKILKAEVAMNRLIDTSDKTAEKLWDIDRQAGEAAEGGVNKLRDGVGNVSDEAVDLGRVTKEVFRAFGINADEAVDSAMEAWKEYKSTVKDVQADSGAKAGLIAGALTGALVPAIGTIIEKVLELGGKLTELAIQAEDTGARLQVALGLTEGEAQAAQGAIDTLNGTGIFEKGEAEKGLATVMRLFDATGERATALTLKIGATAKGTRADFNEIAYAASTIERVFKDTGITADQSLDLILAGLQTGKFESGDFLDSLKEYAPAYERLGYSAQQMVSSLISGVEAGAMSADKVGDSVKEFYNKASSGSTDFKDALKQLGINADQVISRIAEGGPRAQQEYQRITQKVAMLSDETKKAQLASVLFGTQWEDTSTEIVSAASQAGEKIGDVAGKTNEAVDIMTSTTSSKWSGFWSKFGTQAREAVGNFGDTITFNFEGLEARQKKLFDLWTSDTISSMDSMTSTTSSKWGEFWSKMRSTAALGLGRLGDLITLNFEGYREKTNRVYDLWHSDTISSQNKFNSEYKSTVQEGESAATQARQSGLNKQVELSRQKYNELVQAFANGEENVSDEMVQQAKTRLNVAEKSFKDMGSSIPEAMEEGVESNKNSFLNAISNLVNTAQNKWKNFLTSINSGGAKGYALGTPYAQYGTYKVGERGIELVQDKKGNSRLVGINGPQLATLSEGDRVFNAHATKNILERSLNAFDFDSGKISRIANAGIGSHVSSSSKSYSEVINYNFGKGSVVLEARSIKQLNDIADLVQNSPNIYSTQSMRKGYTGE